MCRRTRLIPTVFLAALYAAAAAVGVAAQDDERVMIDAGLVTVNVSVSDARGRHVRGLTKDQFEVFDDKVKQQIAHFSAEEAPFSIGIVYDIHPSTAERLEATLRALKQFTRTLRDGDDFFLMVFNERGSVFVDFVPTAAQVTGHLTYAAPKGPNALYDAAFLAAEKVRAARNAKKALVIISDGQDHNSGHSDKDLRDRVREFNIQVYGVGVADPKDDPSAGRGRWVFEDITGQTGRRTFLSDADAGFGRAVLDEMARASGGTAYFPRTVGGEQELAGICTQIALELRRQYTLAFRHASAPAEAAWHKLEVRVTPPAGTGKLRLSYRKGYRSFKK